MVFPLWFYIWNAYIVRGPIDPGGGESLSNGGADEKHQNDDAENKGEDAQNDLKEADGPEPSPESSKKEPPCKVKSCN